MYQTIKQKDDFFVFKNDFDYLCWQITNYYKEMKRLNLFFALSAITLSSFAQTAKVTGPDGKLVVNIDVNGGKATYSVNYDGKKVLDASPLGFQANIGDFSNGLSFVDAKESKAHEQYQMNRSKFSFITYDANVLKVNLKNARNIPFAVTFQVSNNDIAFRYEMNRAGETGSIRIMSESTGFDFPTNTTTFLTPQSDAMIGWKRTKPSYEEVYKADEPMATRSQYGHGFTFPCLFKVTNEGQRSKDEGQRSKAKANAKDNTIWVLVSETGVDSKYCASHLSDMKGDGLYTIAFPMAEENNGNGSVEPAFALPGATPWRTITVGTTLKPIVETTIPFDVVKPLYETTNEYKFGCGTWSWIVWQDNSINYDDQVRYINLAKEMGYEYVLIDNWWDTNIGTEKMERLVEYAQSQGVDVFLWYSSSGYWNDIVQGPINRMDNPIVRKQWMRWMKKLGVKGIKVDFFGGDKQETMRLYESILSDADDNGLMVIFHGCTLPRGWERMYPNYVGSEAVLASENMVFGQDFCDNEAFNACLHPFIRNAVGCMEWGGCFMNRRLAKGNKSGNTRRSTDCLELATTILYQNPIQNFALTPENLLPEEEGGAPEISMNFLKSVPTTWDETRFIDGYPGKYVIMARRHHNTWYIAGVNATGAKKKFTIDLSSILKSGDAVQLYTDNLRNQDPRYDKRRVISDTKAFTITMDKDGGFVMVK